MTPQPSPQVPRRHNRAATLLLTALLLVSTATAVVASEPQTTNSTKDIAATSEPPVPEDEAHVEGIIISEGTWNGLGNATLTVTNATGSTTTHPVKDDGTFSLILDPGKHTFTANAPQHFTTSRTAYLEGGTREHMRLSLEPHPARLNLQVADADGDPRADAIVTAWNGGTVEEARTDANGTAILDLKVGTVHLRVQDKSTDACRAETRTLGGNASWTFTLPDAPARDATVEGVVTDPRTGEPVAGADVTFHVDRYARIMVDERAGHEGPEEVKTTVAPPHRWEGAQCHRDPVTVTTGADGSYDVALPNGSYHVTARHPDHLPHRTRVDAGPDTVTTVDLQLTSIPPASVHVQGRLVDADGDGVGPGTVSLRNVQWGTYVHARVNDQGRWNATVVPGYTHVNAHVRASCDPVAVAHDGDRTEPHPAAPAREDCGNNHHPVSVTRVYEEASNVTETLVMPSVPEPAAVLEGYVVNASSGDPIAGARLQVRNLDTAGWGTARTDEDGSYRIRVHPGTHQVRAYGSGFLPWQGMVEVPHPDERPGPRPFDVELTPGEPRYGRVCCMDVVYAREPAYAGGDASPGPDGGSQDVVREDGAGSNDGTLDDGSAGAGDTRYADLGGGLGDYDPDERARVLSSYEDGGSGEVPAPGLPMLLALLGAVAVMRARNRRR